MALGNLTDLCLITWTWFLMISGNPSSKCQRVWPQIRPTFDTSICTELKGLISKWGTFMMSPAGLLDFLSGKLHVSRFWEGDPLFSRWSTCKFLWKPIYFECGFQGDEGPDPLHSFGSVHASAIKTFFTYLRIFPLC